MFHGAGGFYNLCYTLYEAPNRGMRICSMGPGDYDKEMLWQGNPLALEWWNQWVASSALGYGPEGHTLVGRGVVPSGQPLVLWVVVGVVVVVEVVVIVVVVVVVAVVVYLPNLSFYQSINLSICLSACLSV